MTLLLSSDGYLGLKDGMLAIKGPAGTDCCCVKCCCPIFSELSLATGRFIARAVAPSCAALDGKTVGSRSSGQPCQVIQFDELCWECDNLVQFADLSIAILCDFPDLGCFGIGMRIDHLNGLDCPITSMALSPAGIQYPNSCSCGSSVPGNKFWAEYGPYSLTGIGGDPNNCCTEFYIRVEEV